MKFSLLVCGALLALQAGLAAARAGARRQKDVVRMAADEEETFDEWQNEKFKEWQDKKANKKHDSPSKPDPEEERKRLEKEELEKREARDAFLKNQKFEEKRRREEIQRKKAMEKEHEQRQKEIEESRLAREHNQQWREKHSGRKKQRSKDEDWQREQAEELQKERDAFAKQHEDEKEEDPEITYKKMKAAEADELRILEPHVETHNKEQKEQLAEASKHPEEAASIDLLNPDAVVNEGDTHAYDAREPETDNPLLKEAVKEEEEHQARIKEEVEREELRILEPHVETEDKKQKMVHNLMKDKPFQAGDVEAAVHGGGHVDGVQAGAGADNIDQLVNGDVPQAQGAAQEAAGALDPEALLIGDEQRIKDGRKSDGTAPGIVVPEDVSDHEMDWAHDDSKPVSTSSANPKDIRGTDIDSIERAVQGEVKGPKPKPGKKITREDILALGLSEELLKGVDLTKLLAKDQEDYQKWLDDDDDDSDDDEDAPGFWGQMSRFRKEYLDSLAQRIRNIGAPDMAHAEWDKGKFDDHEMPTKKNTDKGQNKAYHAKYHAPPKQ